MIKALQIGTLATIICLVGCQTPPEFSDTPYIEFRQLKITHQPFQDSVWVNVYFRDGKGDLGLYQEDTTGVYFKKNKFYNNYFIDIYRKSGATFTKYNFPDTNFNLNGRFPTLNPDKKTMPIEGTLSYHFNIPKGTLPAKTLVKFKISIADRATNLSNVVETNVDTLK
ncbi:MAG: hypothetical protein K2Q22_11925 [Cytophagales bacterium]|nr:hypothetical protein [Cytophagales bacterium]